MMKTVVVCDAIHQKGFELLEKEDDIKVIDATNLAKDELLKVIVNADVAITRSPTEIGSKFLDAGKNLTAIVRAGVGVDNVDIDNASKKGIIIMNVPTANTIAAVEMTMCHILNCARKFINSSNDLKVNRSWKREKWYGIELFGKTLGIIGFGNIGSRVAQRAMAFGMNIIAYDPYIDPTKVTSMGGVYTENLDDILKNSDFITIHTPKTNETIDIISQKDLDKLKDGVRLINCARGGLYNEAMLVKGLKSGKIASLGIDVLEKEPATNHELLEFENVGVTPHLGANTYESQEKIAVAAAEQAISAIRGISYPNALNLPIRKDSIPEFVVPYIELISKMAYFGAQISNGSIREIHLKTEGDIGSYAESMLIFAIVGAMKHILGDQINYVNAKFVAEEKDIKTSVTTLEEKDYRNKATISLITQSGITEISGTVFSQTEQRIVSINGFKTDFKPKGKMIVFKNEDVPGVIMSVASILKDANINIADFRLGRGEEGYALAVILLDENISKDIISKISNLSNCVWAHYAVL
ncbi:phosphoglycerate dehydrogenase [Campylobacter sputorum]|uniref:phosphoglycerate dehydrogenase n=1 Tax=Campylobacter sputorum TaxID=206 RepID=UPI001F4CA91C|nr:phosphoglycerate dehydrogenase [Campylobacter sputorum]